MLGAFKGDRWEIFRTVLIVGALAAEHWIPEELARIPAIIDRIPIEALPFLCGVFLLVLVVFLDATLRTRAMYAIRRSSELKAFEGAWSQNVDIAERPYSLAIIAFDPHQGRWTYCGIGFSRDFKPAAEWHTFSLHFDKRADDRPWLFAGQAHLRVHNPQLGRAELKGGKGSVVPRLSLPADLAANTIEGHVTDIEVGGVSKIFGVTLRRVKPDVAATVTSLPAILEMSADEVKDVLVMSGALPQYAT